MKKFSILFLFLSLVSCNDGDFDIPAFEFTETVESCGEYVLYITSSEKTETLAITLTTNEIGEIIGEETHEINTTLQIIYRIFDAAIGTNYFCEAIPPTSPKVLKDLKASSGTITIVTSEILENAVVTGYSYEITISNLLFNENNERIFFEHFNFGAFTRNID